jgi:hypothetical protein
MRNKHAGQNNQQNSGNSFANGNSFNFKSGGSSGGNSGGGGSGGGNNGGGNGNTVSNGGGGSCDDVTPNGKDSTCQQEKDWGNVSFWSASKERGGRGRRGRERAGATRVARARALRTWGPHPTPSRTRKNIHAPPYTHKQCSKDWMSKGGTNKAGESGPSGYCRAACGVCSA